MRKMYVIVFSAAAACFFQAVACADEFTLNVLEDAYINDFNATGPTDGIPDEMRNTNALLSGTGILSDGDAIESRTVMVFDLAPYWGIDLSKAELTGFGRRVDAWSNRDPITLGVYHYAGDGAVTLDDFNRPASYLADLTLPNPGDFSYPFFTLDVTGAVQQALDNDSRYLEFKLVSDKLTGYITAGEVPAAFTPDLGRTGPQLKLTMVPEPCSMLLFSVGCGVLVAAKKVCRSRVQGKSG